MSYRDMPGFRYKALDCGAHRGRYMTSTLQKHTNASDQEAGNPILLDPLLDGIYASALSAHDYTAVLEQLGRCLGYSAVGVITTRSKYSEPECSAGWNVDTGRWTQAEREFGVLAELSAGYGRPMEAGEFAFLDELVSIEQLHRKSWFGLLQDHPEMQNGLLICLENSVERLIFAALRGPTPWPESPADRERRRQLVARLAPHWARAAQIHLQINTVEMLRRAYAEAANIVPFAMVVFDNNAQVFLCNARAQRLLGKDGLMLEQHGLKAQNKTQSRLLQETISKAVKADSPDCWAGKSPDMLISRPSGKRPYQVTVKPLSPGYAHNGRRPAAAALIIDPDERLAVTLERCQALFGFTRAESLVAVGIMQGHSVQQIAATQGNSIATVRNLLKRAFQKAGVQRQHELTRLLLSSPLAIDFNDML